MHTSSRVRALISQNVENQNVQNQKAARCGRYTFVVVVVVVVFVMLKLLLYCCCCYVEVVARLKLLLC